MQMTQHLLSVRMHPSSVVANEIGRCCHGATSSTSGLYYKGHLLLSLVFACLVHRHGQDFVCLKPHLPDL